MARDGGDGKRIAVVGGGPAGMMLAYLLAKEGARVTVLERHPDFHREFRGETVQPDVVQLLQELGIHQKIAGATSPLDDVLIEVANTPVMRVRGARGPASAGAELIPQPLLLETLHAECSRHPGYQILFNTAVARLGRDGRDGGRVTHLVVRREGREERIDADLVVVCSGRGSPLRQQGGAKVEHGELARRALWMAFDQPPGFGRGMSMHVAPGGDLFVIFPTQGQRVLVAWSKPDDGSAAILKTHDITALKEALLRGAPARLRPLVAEQLSEATSRQFFNVAADLVETWHAPGVLFLGDAAHTMQAIGGYGINVAIQDAVCAADHLLEALGKGESLDLVGPRVQAERKPRIAEVQKRQARMAWLFYRAPTWLQKLLFRTASAFAALAASRFMTAAFKLRHIERRSAGAPQSSGAGVNT